MQVTRGFGVIFLALLLITFLTSGGFLHNVLPHDHHNEGVWESLHTAVRHEEHAAFVGVSVALSFFLSLVALAIFVPNELFAVRVRDEYALSRGIFKYRKFK